MQLLEISFLEYGALGSLGDGRLVPIDRWRRSFSANRQKILFLQADGTIKTQSQPQAWMIHVGDGATATSINIEIGSTPIKL